MLPTPNDLKARYAQLSEPELLVIARSYDELTEPAQAALRLEFSHRNLDPPLLDQEEELPAELTTIRRYRDLSEAIVARSFLESAGISAFLQDENLVRLDWQVSNFIGGIRLQVPSSDQQTALNLLDEPIPDPIIQPGEPDFAQPHCPRCDSTNITFQGTSRGAALVTLYLASIPIPLGRETWRCNHCDAVWTSSEDEDGSTINA